ncbi:MAG: arylesterase [Rhodospirillales bacterium]|nr:arylesterase [Rhodospirillales bacterium]
MTRAAALGPGRLNRNALAGAARRAARWRYGAAADAFKAAAWAALLATLCAAGSGLGLGAASADGATRPLRLMVLGDSLAAGYGLANADGFVPRLEAALRAEGYDVLVIGAGVSGDTSAGGLARLPWLLSAPAQEQPDAVMVELGGNDGLRGLDPQAMERNLDAILTLLADRNLPAMLAGMKAPPNLGADYGRSFAAVFPRLADKHDVPLYDFFLEGVAADPALNQADGIHPNAAGVQVIVRLILPATKAFLDSVKASTAAAGR